MRKNMTAFRLLDSVLYFYQRIKNGCGILPQPIYVFFYASKLHKNCFCVIYTHFIINDKIQVWYKEFM